MRKRTMALALVFVVQVLVPLVSLVACTPPPVPAVGEDVATLQALVVSLQQDLEATTKQLRLTEERADACEARKK